MALLAALFLPSLHLHDPHDARQDHGVEVGLLHRHAASHEPARPQSEASAEAHDDAIWLTTSLYKTEPVKVAAPFAASAPGVLTDAAGLPTEFVSNRVTGSTHDPPWTPTGLRAPPQIPA